MNKEEIKHFKAMLRQGQLRHMNMLLDDKFQKELLNIIKDYEKLQQQNKELHNKIDELEEYSRGNIEACENRLNSPFCNFERVTKELMIHKNYLEILKDSDVDE